MEFKRLSDKGWGKTSPKENASTSEKKSSQYGTKLPVKSGFLHVRQPCASQLLPGSCRNVVAIGQIQSHQVAPPQLLHHLHVGAVVVTVLSVEVDQMLEGGEGKTHWALRSHELGQGCLVQVGGVDGHDAVECGSSRLWDLTSLMCGLNLTG